jgi:two-component sensor histidine kinase
MTAKVPSDSARLKPPKSIAPALRLSALAITSVILLVLLLIGWRTWQNANRNGQETGLGLQQLVHSQVERVFDLSEVLLELMTGAVLNTDFNEPGAAASAARDLRLLRQALPVFSSLWIVAPDGRLIASTLEAAVTGNGPLYLNDWPGFILAEQERNKTHVVGPTVGRLDGKPSFALARAVVDNSGRFLGVIIVSLDPDVIAQTFRTVDESFGAHVVVFRDTGEVLVSVPQLQGDYVDRHAPPALMQSIAEDEALEGPPAGAGSAFVWRLANYPIYVSVDLPRSLIVDRWVGSSWYLLVSLVATLLALTIAFWALHRRALVEDRAALALDREVARQTANLRHAVHEKDLLLRELHHRVKNNLQVVMSLLALQAQRSKGDPKAYFQESQRRLAAIAKMHQHLYLLADVAALSLVPYLRELAVEIAAAHGCEEGVDIVVRGDDVSVALDQATAIVLIAGEVMSNAFKHAFKDGREGHLTCEVSRSPGGARIVIEDDGPGFAEGNVPSDSLGMLLIRNLAIQARGAVSYAGTNGGRFELLFETSTDSTPPDVT